MRTLSIVLPYRGLKDARIGLRVLDFANRQYGPPPPLLTSGVRWVREPRGRERWASWPVALEEGEEDCEGLGSWYSAETGGVSLLLPVNPRLLHVVTLTGNGEVIDPSAALGMFGNG